MVPLADAHCHFDFPAFDGVRPAVLEACNREHIERLVVAGVGRSGWQRQMTVCAGDGRLYSAFGIHPWEVERHADEDLTALEALLARPPDRCVALGETGLDRLRGDLHRQQHFFEKQLALAGKLDFPVVIHSVRCHDQVHATLRRMRLSVPVYVHGFSGSYEEGRKLTDLGAYLGIGGVITHQRAAKTRRAVARLPLERLVLETDAPDMPPAGVAAGQNSPLYLPRILASLCELREEGEEQIRTQLWENACNLYRWPKERA